jgi:hypothetical protein
MYGAAVSPLFYKNSPPKIVKEAEQEFNLIREEYLRNPKSFNSEIFQSLINGLFKARD